jgi:hypothetical protein
MPVYSCAGLDAANGDSDYWFNPPVTGHHGLPDEYETRHGRIFGEATPGILPRMSGS